MFQRFSDEGLAQNSYLIACERTRDAIVVDPRRDIDGYLAAATQQQLKIAYAIETHVHADFVSGAREPIGEITRRAGELRGAGTVATMCEGGFRSSLAASLLKRAGVDVVNVTGGMNAYRTLESTS